MLDAFNFSGQRMLHFAMASGGGASALRLSMLYSIENDYWTLSNFATPLRITDLDPKIHAQSPIARTYAISITLTGGKTFRLYPVPDYDDDGVAYSAVIQLTKLDFGTPKRKIVSCVELICDTQASGTATLEYSDDDFVTWITAGTFDMTSMRPRVHRCGSHRGGRSYRITHSANTAFRAQALDVSYEVCT